MAATVLRARLIACAVGLLIVTVGRPAAAETLTLVWDPSPNTGVAGYVVYVRISGATSNSYDVGNARSFSWDGAVEGQQYYFSIAAYTPGPVLGPRSAEIPRYPDLAPSLFNPGPQSSAVGSAVSLALTARDPEGAALNYGVSGLPPGLQLIQATGTISGSPSTVGSYVVTASVSDGALSDAKTFVWAIAQPGSDTVPPVVAIALPTTASSYTVGQPVVLLGGTASDESRITAVEWFSDRGMRGAASGAESWVATVTLVSGLNIVTIRARDEAGNVGTRQILVKALIPSTSGNID